MRLALLLLAFLAVSASAAKAPPARTFANPVLDADFPDPAVLKAPDGFYYAYATQAERDGQAPDVRWHRRKDGSRFFVDGVQTAIRDEGGALVGFSKLMRDVTYRQRAEQALAAARAEGERTLARLRAVIQSMHEGLVLADAAGNLLEWNPAALAMHGYESPDEARRPLAGIDRLFELSVPGGAPVPLADWPMSRRRCPPP